MQKGRPGISDRFHQAGSIILLQGRWVMEFSWYLFWIGKLWLLPFPDFLADTLTTLWTAFMPFKKKNKNKTVLKEIEKLGRIWPINFAYLYCYRQFWRQYRTPSTENQWEHPSLFTSALFSWRQFSGHLNP